MLVLSRQRDESVIINEDIEIRVIDVRGEKVRLGFIAPRSVSIHRKEIYDAIRRENRDASTMSPADVPMLSGPHATAISPLVGGEPLDEAKLELALAEAVASRDAGGIASGCVIVAQGAVIARGRAVGAGSMVQAAMDAARQLRHASDATAYLTRPPTLAGAAALAESGVRRAVIGAGVLPATARELIIRLGVVLIERNDPRCSALLTD